MLSGSIDEMPVRTILLDIEGTTTPVDFVYQILFPYARARLKDFIERHLADEEVRAIVADLICEYAHDKSIDLPSLSLSDSPDEGRIETVVVYGQWLMDHDRKITPLKTLQGKIWEEGYRSGELKSEVFPDVAPNLRGWRAQGKTICIYSSGSVLAQKLLFAHTGQGDLTDSINDYFDTAVGHKTEPNSYLKIAGHLQQQHTEILFISDVVAELDAARAAGLQTLLCIRSGNRPQSNLSAHVEIHTFDEVMVVAS
jgi:enolase-phosphatase E1